MAKRELIEPQGERDANEDGVRGKRATFDRKTGEVSGSGSGIGNPEGSDEDYSSDLATGSGSDRKSGGPSNSA